MITLHLCADYAEAHLWSITHPKTTTHIPRGATVTPSLMLRHHHDHAPQHNVKNGGQRRAHSITGGSERFASGAAAHLRVVLLAGAFFAAAAGVVPEAPERFATAAGANLPVVLL